MCRGAEKAMETMPDDFDSILDNCLADIAAGRATIETCLRNYSTHAGQLVVLLETAERAKTLLPPAHLPDDKRRVLESRLLRQAAQIQARPASRPVAARRPVYRRGFAWLAASVVVVFLLISSAVGASAASVPGEFLYPVKRTTEQVRLALAPQEGQVDLHLEFARQRLQELQVVERRGEVSEELLTEISAETALVLDKIPTLPREKQREELASLTVFQDQHLQALEAIAASAPGRCGQGMAAWPTSLPSIRPQPSSRYCFWFRF
jgi:hypothetical protein